MIGGAPERHQDDLARTIRPERDDAGADTAARIANHAIMAPNAFPQVAMAFEPGSESPLPGQTDLPAVGMARQIQPVPFGGPPSDFRRMNQGDAEAFGRSVKRRVCLFGVQSVYVIQAGNVQIIGIAGQRQRFVQ